ncbi:MAG TPA: glycosyltransferase family 4 protein [Gemmatimonadaceae bacterium]|nr:glycosyltransferase family 4 protein [Gemmatimonadaceae bacterium]
MTPLRFCMVSTFYPPYSYGGDGITVQRLSRALVEAGHEVTVVHDADAYAALGHPAPHGEPVGDGVNVITLTSGSPRLSALLTHQLGRPVVHAHTIQHVLDSGHFDVVHFHNVSLVGGPGVLSYPPSSAATLYTAHEHWLVCPMHVLWRYDREPCDRRECVRCTLSYGRPPQLWRDSDFYRQQLDHVDTFIALSEFSRAKHHEFGFPRPMEVLPPLIDDAPVVDRSADGAPPHPRSYFLCVARLERIKGLHTVIPLFGPDAPADLVIAGAGSQADELRALAAGSPRIHFVGRLTLDQLRRYYRHAIAHIAASICFETFGNTVVEAFQQATPVVARRIGPFPELVEQSGGGMMYSTDGELRAALVALASDVSRRDRLGAQGRRAYEATWSPAAIVPRYLELVERTRAKGGESAAVAAVAP